VIAGKLRFEMIAMQ